MSTPRSAAIYARISSDPEGHGLGVARQLEDCRKLAASRGWSVGEEYIDNDASAYSGKRREAYEAMVTDIQAGLRDAVIVYNLDRLTRQPAELESFVALCAQVGVHDVATVTADIDLGNDDGLFMARVFAAFAAKESGRRSARVKRKNDERAAAGRPHGGGTRSYGYDQDRLTVVPGEAVMIRECARRLVDGESLRSIARDLDVRGIRTVTGAPWRTQTLRSLLSSPRVAGLREHRGTIVGEAAWAPILSPAQREQIVAALDARKVSGRRAPRRYLLSGKVRCARCGQVMFSNPRGGVRRYACLSGPDHGGCGSMVVVAEPLEFLIIDAVFERLDGPDLAAVLAGRAADDTATAALLEQVGQDQAQLDELAELFAVKAITAREWMKAREPVEARQRDTQKRLDAATRSTALTGLVGQGSALARRWEQVSFGQQVAVVSALLDHVAIAAATRGTRSFDPARAEPVWLV